MPVTVQQSRAVPVEVDRAFDLTLPMPLPRLFSRRYALLPPVTEVREQVGAWGQVGQTRTVVTGDGGTMREQLVEVDAPRSFSYRLDGLTGPLRPLLSHVDGQWAFAARGTGTEITWRWTLHPTAPGRLVVPLVARMWPGYAQQALELLSEQLLATDAGASSRGASGP